ncbi:MAG: transposase, partial [Hyphomicrobium sp.]|nr:transposase [Hyphomicrobium sp.]
GVRGRPLSERQQNANRKKSKVRARVEHIFGAQETAPGGRIVRSIGFQRAAAKIGLQNLVYNMRRMVILERGVARRPEGNAKAAAKAADQHRNRA